MLIFINSHRGRQTPLSNGELGNLIYCSVMILIKFLSVDLIITPRLKNTRKKYVVYSANRWQFLKNQQYHYVLNFTCTNFWHLNDLIWNTCKVRIVILSTKCFFRCITVANKQKTMKCVKNQRFHRLLSYSLPPKDTFKHMTGTHK